MNRWETLIHDARSMKPVLAAAPIEKIIATLDQVGRLWSPGTECNRRALNELQNELSFSREMIEYSLSLVPELLSARALSARLAAELGSTAVLDGFVRKPGFAGRVAAVPHGVLLHVTAGNVFLGFLDSVVSAFLTKNVSIVKLSSRNQSFPKLFEQCLREADKDGVLSRSLFVEHWRGGDAEIESLLKREVDAILVWGGAEMVRSYREGLPLDVPLIEHGPKISIQVLTRAGLETRSLTQIGAAIANDISRWDQAACASPQNLFVEEGVAVESLMQAVGEALERKVLSRGKLEADEHVEILKEEFRGKLTSLTEGGALLKGRDWLLHFDPSPGLRPSALNRTLILKRFISMADLRSQLAPHARQLQSCSYLVGNDEKDGVLRELALAGLTRFAPLGTVMDGMLGAPHDGRQALAELVRMVGDECEPEPADDGYFFSSGGTTGNPKFARYAREEFNEVGRMLAKGFRAQGIEPGDVCANLFMAGNLWSSFLAVDRALGELGAVSLPVGAAGEPELVLGYLERFKPRAVLGLPSYLVSLANHARSTGRKLEIELACYAGEHLTRQSRELLSEVFGVKRCFSAGYASVDAGPIGYQCAHCKEREHHLFAGQVALEIIDGEAVVTSNVRKKMPVRAARTGDQVEWVAGAGPCACGSADPKFILHGRVDGQINLWSCRLQLSDIESALYAAGYTQNIFQVRINEDETMLIQIEGAPVIDAAAKDALRRHLHACSKDLHMTHQLAFLASWLDAVALPIGALPRLARTGKVRAVVDAREL